MKRLLFVPIAMLALLSIPHVVAAGPLYVGALTDPLNDNFIDGPDIVSAQIDIDDLLVTFTMRFASGTWDPATTKASFILDLDQNSATGVSSGGIGAEATVSQGYLGNTGTAFLNSASPGVTAGSAPVDFLADGVRYSFARGLFGTEDGLLDFVAVVQVALAPNAATTFRDWAPDFRDGPASTIAAVPEPATLSLLAGGLSVLSAYRRRARSRRSDR